MASLNKVLLIGNLGRDPELRYMPNGEAVCNFSIATTESWKAKDGSKQDKTEWHNIVMYRKLAEVAGEYLKKGSSVYLEGKLQTRKWQDKSGQDRYTTEILADEMKMLGGRGSAGADAQRAAPPDGASGSSAGGPDRGAFNAPPNKVAKAGDDFEDDIPF